MPTRAKSRNDTKKEAAEEQCFKLALDAARRRGGGTYKIDKYNDGGVSFTPPEVTHRNEDGEYQAKYSYSILPLDKDRNQRIWPAFKTAYYAHKRGVPFVATREIQAALFTLGKFVDRFYGVGTDVGVAFQKKRFARGGEAI